MRRLSMPIADINTTAQSSDGANNTVTVYFDISAEWANGDSTQINGVAPHIHIPSMNDHREFGEGKMDNAVKFEKVAPLAHDEYHRVPAELVAQLNERSADRRKTRFLPTTASMLGLSRCLSDTRTMATAPW